MTQGPDSLAGIKRALFDAGLSCGHVYLTAIPSQGLDLPPERRGEVTVLEYGYAMPIPIQDMDVTDEGVSATLFFNQTPHKTFVPWAAVVKMHQEGGFVAMFPVEVVLRRTQQKAVA